MGEISPQARHSAWSAGRSNIRVGAFGSPGNGGSLPTYEFECVACHEIRNVTASMFVNVIEQFCEYDGEKMYKVFTSPGVIWNARGFYKTDGG